MDESNLHLQIPEDPNDPKWAEFPEIIIKNKSDKRSEAPKKLKKIANPTIEVSPDDPRWTEFPKIADGDLRKVRRRFHKTVKEVITDVTRSKVYELACQGKELDDIAVLVGFTPKSINKSCKAELKKGRLIALANDIPVKKAIMRDSVFLSDKERYQLRVMAGLGLQNDQIALLLNISLSTLQTDYQDELYIGRAQAHEKVSQVLYDMATDYEHPNETKFFLKTQAGWKETSAVEFPDENGRPQSLGGTNVNLNISGEKMQTIIALLNEKV
jgi:hypothetical protein